MMRTHLFFKNYYYFVYFGREKDENNRVRRVKNHPVYKGKTAENNEEMFLHSEDISLKYTVL